MLNKRVKRESKERIRKWLKNRSLNLRNRQKIAKWKKKQEEKRKIQRTKRTKATENEKGVTNSECDKKDRECRSIDTVFVSF